MMHTFNTLLLGSKEVRAARQPTEMVLQGLDHHNDVPVIVAPPPLVPDVLRVVPDETVTSFAVCHGHSSLLG